MARPIINEEGLDRSLNPYLRYLGTRDALRGEFNVSLHDFHFYSASHRDMTDAMGMYPEIRKFYELGVVHGTRKDGKRLNAISSPNPNYRAAYDIGLREGPAGMKYIENIEIDSKGITLTE